VRALRARGEARPGWGDFGPSKASAYTSNNYITPRPATIDASVRYLSEEIAERVAAETSPVVLMEVGSRLEKARARDAEEDTLADREVTCAETLARKDVQRKLGRLLVPLSDGILALDAARSDSRIGDLTVEASLARFQNGSSVWPNRSWERYLLLSVL